MIGMFKSISGLMELELTSADPARTVQDLLQLGVQFYELSVANDLNVTFQIQKGDYAKIQQYAKKRGFTLEIKGKRGIYWSICSALRRPVLILGLILAFAVFWFVPGRIYLFEVQGNDTVPSRLILEAAADCGIRFGISSREVRSEKMKNALLARLPQLQWAGINTYGSRAVITVRERNQEEELDRTPGVSSIVADRDGIVISCTVSEGSPMVAPGQAVQKGQVLISGYTYCGLSIEATRAEGEVFARTMRNLTVKTASTPLGRTRKSIENVKYSLLIGKKRINFYKGSGISDGSCVKMYSKYVLTLPGGFSLPVVLIKESVTKWETEEAVPDKELVHAEMEQFAERYLRGQMIAGTIIRHQTSYADEGEFTMTGQYECQEMIGRVRPEQIGVYNGKTD
jgi:sporulation protein YqfD